MDNILLELKNIKKSFGKKIVANDISIKVKKGEICAFLGSSGCGKSTLFKMIAGFTHPDDGEIIYDGVSLNSKRNFIEPQERNIGMIFQHFALFPHMIVWDNIHFAAKKNLKTDIKTSIQEVIQELELEGLENRYPNELSGGEAQRVAIARAIIIKPKLLLLDEPFSGIDTNVKIKLQSYIFKVIKKHNLSAILITHSKEEAMSLCDKIALFHNGALVQHNSPMNLYENPKTKYIASFMGVANFVYKDNKEYCIRAEHCRVSFLYGDMEGIVEEIKYLGGKIEVCVKNYEISITTYERVEEMKNIHISDKVYVKIDWNKAKLINNKG